ncbi:MAG: SDR family oxidoreductase [Anaplasmataceae bacterium]|nr:SDR family oxidoreductase [Anaplasmataceae bacterium]
MLNGKVVFISGVNNLFAVTVAKRYAKEGAQLIICGDDNQILANAAEEITEMGNEVIPFKLSYIDIEKKSISHIKSSVDNFFGRLDILVILDIHLYSNHYLRLSDYSYEDWEKIENINYRIPLYLLHAFDSFLRTADLGKVVFLGNLLLEDKKSYLAPYHSSRAALYSVFQSYAKEISGTNMKVNMVLPCISDLNNEDLFSLDILKQNITDIFVKLSSNECKTSGVLHNAIY